MRPSLAWLLLLAACSGNGNSTPGDGGVDAAVDASMSTGGQLCTTAACAAAPCTADCLYQLASGGACPANLPRMVDLATVKACPGYCALYSGLNMQNFFGMGYCWHYDANLPGACQAPHCGWNVACEVHSDFYNFSDQAVICPSSEQCWNGLEPADMQAICDLATSD
jgi:hypothetical protein